MQIQKLKLYKILIGTGLVIVFYTIYVVTAKIYDDYLIERQVLVSKLKNEQIAKQYERNIDDLKYFESDRYVEKIAKEQLGLVLPGEEVVVLMDEKVNTKLITEDNRDRERIAYLRLSNPQKWWYYFWGRSISE